MSIWSACILLMGLFKCPTVLEGCEECWRCVWSVRTVKGYSVRKRTENAWHYIWRRSWLERGDYSFKKSQKLFDLTIFFNFVGKYRTASHLMLKKKKNTPNDSQSDICVKKKVKSNNPICSWYKQLYADLEKSSDSEMLFSAWLMLSLEDAPCS